MSDHSFTFVGTGVVLLGKDGNHFHIASGLTLGVHHVKIQQGLGLDSPKAFIDGYQLPHDSRLSEMISRGEIIGWESTSPTGEERTLLSGAKSKSVYKSEDMRGTHVPDHLIDATGYGAWKEAVDMGVPIMKGGQALDEIAKQYGLVRTSIRVEGPDKRIVTKYETDDEVRARILKSLIKPDKDKDLLDKDFMKELLKI